MGGRRRRHALPALVGRAFPAPIASALDEHAPLLHANEIVSAPVRASAPIRPARPERSIGDANVSVRVRVPRGAVRPAPLGAAPVFIPDLYAQRHPRLHPLPRAPPRIERLALDADA